MFKNKKLINNLILILILLFTIIIYIKVETINSMVNLILTAIVLAYILKPIVNYFTNKYSLSRRLVSLLLLLLILALAIGTIILIIPSMYKESHNIGKILDNMDQYAEKFLEKMKVNNIKIFEDAYTQISEKINMYIMKASLTLIDSLVSFLESLISIAIIPIITYYFLIDGKLIYNKFLLILPTSKRIVAKRIIRHVDKVLSRYIISQFFLSFIIGILTFVTLFLFDIKFSIILGVINGILNIVPYFGPIIGGLPAVFIAFMESPETGLCIFIVMIIIQQIEGNILSPKITGDSTNMHPIMIIILLLIGEKLGGFVGMIIIVPIGVIIKVIYDDLNDYLF